MDIYFRQSHTENDVEFIKRLETYQSQNAAAKTFCTAIVDARKATHFEGLRRYQNESGEWSYNAAQGAKAACLTAEDASATLQMQLPILKRLDGIATLVKACLVALAYIAFRVS